MKIKSEFILREVAGENVVIFLSNELSDKVVTLNSTGAFLFGLLKEEKTEEELISALTDEYEIEKEAARNDIKRFIESLAAIGAVEE